MPWELPPHFSHRWSDTGPNLGYHIDPLLNAEVIAFFFFDSCSVLWEKDQNVKKSVDLTPPNDPSFTLIQVDDHYEWGLTWKLMCQSVLFLPFYWLPAGQKPVRERQAHFCFFCFCNRVPDLTHMYSNRGTINFAAYFMYSLNKKAKVSNNQFLMLRATVPLLRLSATSLLMASFEQAGQAVELEF